MPGFDSLEADVALNPFSARGFAEKARACGIALGKASWMAAQPISYGIDAGRRLGKPGEPNENLKLEHLVPPSQWRQAAVLVPVMAREPEATVLFTLRTAHLAAHSGQISFPGGKIEECDATPVETAIREAEEEVGIPPALVTPLSLLDLHNTGTGFRIVPVLAVVEPVLRAGAASGRGGGSLRGAALVPDGGGEPYEAPVRMEGQHRPVPRHGIRAPLHLGRHGGDPPQSL